MKLNVLEGKKTYIVAAGIILMAVGGLLSGDLTIQDAVQQGLTGLGLGTLRLGVATTAQKEETSG